MAVLKTYRNQGGRFGRIAALIVVALALCAVFVVATLMNSAEVKQQGAETLRTAIVDGAKQCAAIEGAYPVSLKYLEDRYGLVVDHSKYIVNYDAFAQNVMPTVTVIPR